MRLIQEERVVTYRIVLVTAGMLMGWAVLHDQFLVGIAPEHFTEYHEPVGSISNPRLLAFLYALGATVGPGLILGILCAFFGRSGSRRKVPLKGIFLGVAALILAIEVLSAGAGIVVSQTGKVFYPEDWFPDQTDPIRISQTIQVTCYLSAFLLSPVLCLALFFWRRN
jgi:hypothetical protein